jgi:hypothetical protein
MKRQAEKLSFSLVLALAGTMLPAPARAIRAPRVELLREVTVSGARVLLSDLLPAGSDRSVRAQAENVSLGAAPQPGTLRTIERSGIVTSMTANPGLLEEIAVPERVEVRSGARALMADEILAAIRGALREESVVDADRISARDILIQSEVFVRESDSGLEVLSSQFDPGMQRARFLLRASRDPNVLPFYVVATLPRSSVPSRNVPAGMGTTVTVRAVDELPRLAAPQAKPAILVSPGENATLVMASASVSLMADVVPLERGALGQQILVRVADTGKVFRAKVDGRAHLQVEF